MFANLAEELLIIVFLFFEELFFLDIYHLSLLQPGISHNYLLGTSFWMPGERRKGQPVTPSGKEKTLSEGVTRLLLENLGSSVPFLVPRFPALDCTSSPFLSRRARREKKRGKEG